MARLLEKVSLKKYNTFGVEAFADYFFEFSTIEELTSFLSQETNTFKIEELPHIVLGGGSNMLFVNDFDGLVLYPQIKGCRVVRENEKYAWVEAGAGLVWDDFVLWCIDKGLSGAENLSGIPGSVGASPIQNIGAYGVEVKELIYEVEALRIHNNKNVEQLKFSTKECKFGYRNSIFKSPEYDDCIITNVTYRLNKTFKVRSTYNNIGEELRKSGISQPTIKDIREVILNIRSQKIPSPEIYGNAGSFFKNPIVDKDVADVVRSTYPMLVSYDVSDTAVKIPAGWLIEQCGWKGRRFGDVGVHRNQALVLLNYGKATGKEILNLARQIQYNVLEKFGVELEMEVNIV